MRKVIVNSTPLITLCANDLLWILRSLYGEITIPQAVYDEVTAKPDTACEQVKQAHEWIHVEQIRDDTERKMYRVKLHKGEVEVMILAQQEPIADVVIIDDDAAKKTAKYLGLPVVGTLGVLLKAKQEGFVQLLAPLLERMRRSGFYIDDSLLNTVLKIAGE